MIFLFCFALIKINYRFDQPQNEYQYYISSGLFFAITTVIEGSAMAIIAKTIPPALNSGYWNSGLFGGCAELLGRGIGNISFTIYTKFNGLKTQPFLTYIVTSVTIFVCLIILSLQLKRFVKHIEIEIVKS